MRPLNPDRRDYMVLLEGINGCIICCDKIGNILFINKKTRDMLGIEAGEPQDFSVFDFVAPQERDVLNKTLTDVLEKSSAQSFESCVLGAKGIPRPIRLNLSLLPEGERGEDIILILLEDLSERRQFEDAFIESEQHLAHIIDFLPDAILAVDNNGRVIAWNRAAEEMTGVRAREIMGKGNYEYALPFYGYRRPLLLNQFLSDMAEWEKSYVSYEKKGYGLRGENFCPAIGENGAYLQSTAAPLFDAGGKLIGAIETIHDISRKRQAEAIVAIQRELITSLVEINEIGEAWPIFLELTLEFSGMQAGAIFSADKEIRVLNHSSPEAFPESLVAEIREVVFSNNEAQYSQTLYSVADEQGAYNCETIIREGFKGLAIIPICHKNRLFAYLALISRSGKTLPERSREALESMARYLGTVIARLWAEDELKESEERFRQLVEVSPDTIAVHIDGRLVFINQAGARLLGAEKAEDILGRRVMDFIHPDSRQLYIDLLEPLLAHGTFPLSEMKVIPENGSTVYTEVAGASLLFKGTPAVQYIMRDISSRKKAQQELSLEVYKLRVLYDLAVSMSSSQNLDETLGLAASKIKELYAADCIFTFLMDESRGEAFPHNLAGNKTDDWFELRIPYGDGLVGMVAASGKGYIFRNYLGNTHFTHTYDELVREEGLICGLAAPIRTAGASLGVLVVAYRKALPLSRANLDTLTLIANLLAVEITRERAEESLQKSLKHLEAVFESTVNALSLTAEKKDPYTAGHQHRVALLASAIAKEMKLAQPIIDNIRTASILHDIGKMQIPTDILSKPGDLTAIERLLVKTHPQAGYEIVNTIPFAHTISSAILQHHERIDGSGYPRGLAGEEIILEARILAVADVVEAMASHRPYRPALGIESALEEIRQGAGIIYDAEVVGACLRVFSDSSFSFD